MVIQIKIFEKKSKVVSQIKLIKLYKKEECIKKQNKSDYQKQVKLPIKL